MNETAASGVPRVGRSDAAPPNVAGPEEEPRRTAPLSVLVGTLQSAQGAILPAIFIAFSTGSSGLLIGLAAGFALAAIGALFSWIAWRRLTYTIRAQDIRVESGVLSRSARSVPYERIQDVSLEQSLVPRLFGLVAVKFETGAGGGEDLSLSFLREEQGEELRQLVRARRDEAESGATPGAPGAPATEARTEEPAEPLF
ncbi:MAG: PH domain-containing protein, partial [Erythrobacter sp.]